MVARAAVFAEPFLVLPETSKTRTPSLNATPA
jgi:hypothetical protein